MSHEELSVLHAKCVAAFLDCAKMAASRLEGPVAEKTKTELRKVAEDHRDLDYRNRVFAWTMDNFKKNINEDGNDDDISALFEKQLNDFVKQKVKDRSHSTTDEFERIFRVEAPTTNLNDSELVETAFTQEYIDPITKRTIEKPVKNKKCGHVYDEDSINQIINMNKKAKCPVVGCGNRNPLTKNDLVFDETTMLALRRRQLNK